MLTEFFNPLKYVSFSGQTALEKKICSIDVSEIEASV